MNKCKPFEKQLVAYMHGELDERKIRVLEAHLENCESCRAELEAYRVTLDMLGESLESASAPERISFWHPARHQINLHPVTFADIWFSPRFKAILGAGALASLFFIITANWIVFTVVQKTEVSFEPPKPTEQRPKMTLKKPKSIVRKSAESETADRMEGKSSFAWKPAAGLKEIDDAYGPDPQYVAGGLKLLDDAGVTMTLGRPGTIYSEFNTEQYNYIAENTFRPVLQNPLSTFSIDVDQAAYANVRRFLNDNMLPPPDAVRIEELINYFDYEYPEPQHEDPFAVSMELAECPWNGGHQLALIGLQGLEIDTADLPPNNLVFLLDVSGSMNNPDKLPLVKSAMRLLVGQLRPEDHVSIVVYAGAAGMVLEPTSDKAKILEAIDRLNAGGSTAGGAGIELAYKMAKQGFIRKGNNRVILATDGDFNVGVSSDGELVRLIEKKRETGIFLSVLGFGTGNYKDSKMEQLADKGNGNYAYIDDILEAKKVLVTEMGGTLVTIAKDVKIQVEFNPTAVKAYRLIGYENRVLAAEDFNDDRKDAGELGAGHTVTALYELIPAGSDEPVPMAGDLKYQKTRLVPSNELMTVKLRYKQPDGDVSKLITQAVKAVELEAMDKNPNIAFASAVAEFGLLLRDSEYKGNASYEQLLRRAKQSKGQDEEGYRAEFIRLVERATLIDANK